MGKAYDRYLQQEAQEWFEAYDEATSEGLLEEINNKNYDKDKRRKN